ATISHGAHYFHPIATGGAARGMQPREFSQSKAKIGTLETTLGEESALQAIDEALENEVVLASADNIEHTLQQIVRQLPRHASSPTRVVVGFGDSVVEASSIDAALALIPCVTIAGPALRNRNVTRDAQRVLAAGLSVQAVPVLVARVREHIVKTQLS